MGSLGDWVFSSSFQDPGTLSRKWREGSDGLEASEGMRSEARWAEGKQLCPVVASLSLQWIETPFYFQDGSAIPSQAHFSHSTGPETLPDQETHHGMFPELLTDLAKTKTKQTKWKQIPSLLSLDESYKESFIPNGIIQLIYLTCSPDLFAISKYENHSQRKKILKIYVFKYAPGYDYDGK